MGTPLYFGIGGGVSRPAAVEEAARRWSAVVVGSAVACRAGAVDDGSLIGSSGVCLPSGSTYVAFGISGSPQHLAGVEDAGLIIAVNSDRCASIRESADYHVVADATAVAEALIDEEPAVRIPELMQRREYVHADRGWEAVLPRRVPARYVLDGVTPRMAASVIGAILSGLAERVGTSRPSWTPISCS